MTPSTATRPQAAQPPPVGLPPVGLPPAERDALLSGSVRERRIRAATHNAVRRTLLNRATYLRGLLSAEGLAAKLAELRHVEDWLSRHPYYLGGRHDKGGE